MSTRSRWVALSMFTVCVLAAPVQAGPTETKKFRAEQEKWLASPDRHERVMKSCGHDIKVVLDWDAFNLEAFRTAKVDNGSMALGDYCSSALDELGDVCNGALGAEFAEAAKKVTTVTCKYKACDKVASQIPTEKHPDRPGFEYSLSKDGTGIDELFCEMSTRNTSYGTRWWLKKIL